MELSIYQKNFVLNKHKIHKRKQTFPNPQKNEKNHNYASRLVQKRYPLKVDQSMLLLNFPTKIKDQITIYIYIWAYFYAINICVEIHHIGNYLKEKP